MRAVLLALVMVMAGPGGAHAQPAAAAPAAPAPAGQPLHLGDALDVLVRQSDALARAEADVAIAEAGELEARGVDDWRVSAGAGWTSNRRGFIVGQPFQTIGDDTLTANAGLERSLPSGGTLGVSMDGRFSRQEFAVLDQTGTRIDTEAKYYETSVIARINHPLLGGMGKKVARVNRTRAEAQRSVAGLARQAVASEAVLEAMRAYWELAYAEGALAIQRSSLELARAQLAITRAAIEGKAAAPTEALAIEQAIAVREQSVLLAEIEIAERSLTLRRVVGMEIGPGQIELHAADLPALADRPLDVDALLKTASQRNPRLVLARKNVDVAAIERIVAEDALRPRLDLSARVGPTGIADVLGDTVEQVFGGDSYTASATLTYGQTLGNRGAKGAKRRVEETVRRARTDVAALERETAVAVVRAVNLVRTARKRVEVSELAIKLAEQNLESEKVLFQAGDTRAFDVLARQDELAQARLSRERALVDYLAALANLDAVTGTLLERQGISVKNGR